MRRLIYLLNKWENEPLKENELNLIINLTKDVQILASKELTVIEMNKKKGDHK